MLTLVDRHRSRRDFLRIGALGLGGLSLADVLRWQSQAAGGKRKAVIQVYLPGGPSHIDTYDMKPDAPLEIRGEFTPIATNVPGLQLCEFMPQLARRADHFSVIRGLKLSGGHNSYEVHTGFRQPGRPVFGAVVSRCRNDQPGVVPPYISLDGASRAEFNDPIDPAYLGTGYRPFVPHGPDLQNLQLARGVSLDRLDQRRALLGEFDTLRRDLDTRGDLAGMDMFTAQALRMLVSPRIRDALDLRREPDRVKNRYGEAGSSLLLARRLIEAGASVVTLSLNFPKGDNTDVVNNWDTHRGNFQSLRWKLPLYDRALSALLTDLRERGLDQDVAVLLCGEMGRTPRVGQSTGASNSPDGRDHWETGFAVLAGGGLKMGQVVGATDRYAERAKGRPYTMQNVLATLYDVLGIDPAATFPDHSGRPQYLLDDREKITELV